MERTIIAKRLRTVAVIAALAGAYFLAGKLGLALAVVHPSATAVWPPTGIALAAALVLGYRVWPALLVGAFLVNASTAGSPATSLGIAVGNTAEGLLGAYLVRRFAGGRRCFDRPQDVLRFALLGAVCAPTASATLGVLSLSLGGFALWSEFGSIWLTWWLGDAAGALVVGPALVLWATRPAALTRRQWIEASLLLALLSLVSLIVFAGLNHFPMKKYPLEFFVVPVLVWAALRFGPRETATATLLLSAIAIWGTMHAMGPFATDDPNQSLLLLQSFMGVVGLTSLVLAAAVVARRQAEEALHATEERLRLIRDRRQAEEALAAAQAIAHLGSWEWNTETNRLTWSAELFRIYGLLEQEFAATYEASLHYVHPDDRERLDSIIRSACADKTPFDFFHRIVRPDGSVRILHGRGEVITEENGRATKMMGTAHDVTEIKQAEEEHAELVREQRLHSDAQAALRERSEFLSVAAHELKTPITNLRLFAQLLNGQLETESLPDARISRSVQVIDRQSEKLATLISQLLDVSRIEAGKLQLSRQATDISDLVTQVADRARLHADGRIITVNAPPDLIATVDPLRLEQVLTNLLDNAIKYSPEHAPIDIHVRRTEKTGLELAVRDFGEGIAMEHRPRIFERFYQAHVHPHSPGLGLGLYISHQIVDLHGGKLIVEAPTDGGSRFVVCLPATMEPLAPTELEAS